MTESVKPNFAAIIMWLRGWADVPAGSSPPQIIGNRITVWMRAADWITQRRVRWTGSVSAPAPTRLKLDQRKPTTNLTWINWHWKQFWLDFQYQVAVGRFKRAGGKNNNEEPISDDFLKRTRNKDDDNGNRENEEQNHQRNNSPSSIMSFWVLLLLVLLVLFLLLRLHLLLLHLLLHLHLHLLLLPCFSSWPPASCRKESKMTEGWENDLRFGNIDVDDIAFPWRHQYWFIDSNGYRLCLNENKKLTGFVRECLTMKCRTNFFLLLLKIRCESAAHYGILKIDHHGNPTSKSVCKLFQFSRWINLCCFSTSKFTDSKLRHWRSSQLCRLPVTC